HCPGVWKVDVAGAEMSDLLTSSSRSFSAVKAVRLFFLFCLSTLVCYGHIGSSTVFYEGAAGPYQVRVSIQPPEVVPGRAQINVRVNNGIPSIVTALPVR